MSPKDSAISSPCPSPARRFNCLSSRSSSMQCSCMGLDQAAGKRALWERVVRSLILPLCLRPTLKLRPSPCSAVLQVSLHLTGLTFWLDVRPTSSLWACLSVTPLLADPGQHDQTRSALFAQVLEEPQPLWLKSQPCTRLAVNLSSLSLADQSALAASWPEKKHSRNGLYDSYFL